MGDLLIREATRDDLPRIVELMAQLFDDPDEDYARHRAAYDRAFDGISGDPRQTLLVAERAGEIVGSLVLMIVPNLGRRGRPTAILENIVVDAAHRGAGIGEALVRYAIEEARRAGCYKAGLTSRTYRDDAHRFYERLGFTVGSYGFRMEL